jgi:hypothetical protein
MQISRKQSVEVQKRDLAMTECSFKTVELVLVDCKMMPSEDLQSQSLATDAKPESGIFWMIWQMGKFGDAGTSPSERDLQHRYAERP